MFNKPLIISSAENLPSWYLWFTCTHLTETDDMQIDSYGDAYAENEVFVDGYSVYWVGLLAYDTQRFGCTLELRNLVTPWNNIRITRMDNGNSEILTPYNTVAGGARFNGYFKHNSRLLGNNEDMYRTIQLRIQCNV